MKLLANLRIATRLVVGFGVVVALMTALVGAAVYEMSGMERAAANIARAGQNEVIALRILDGVNSMRRFQVTALVVDGEERLKELGRVSATGGEVVKLAADLEKRQRSSETRELAGKILALGQQFTRGNDEVMALAKAGKAATMKELIQGSERQLQRALGAEVEKYLKLQEERKAAAEKASEAASTEGKVFMGAILAGAIVLAIVLAFVITRSIIAQLGGEPGYAAEVAKRVADGDLRYPVLATGGSTASVLAAMKNMQEMLEHAITGIRESTDAVNTAAGEISAGNADLSQRTEEQSSSLRTTTASMEDLTSTVRQNADNAVRANQLAATASDVATKGGRVVNQVVETMGSISASSKKIADIINVINGIAFQTNILALNAAVEAARAGESGRGFAVVASEVQGLAKRSAAAAKEIKDLITESSAKVDSGTRLVDEAGRTMDEVVQSVKRVTDIIAEISAASADQSAGIEQVNRAIGQMDQMTQQNSALVEQSAAAAESLAEQARHLQQTVAHFKIAKSGGSGSALLQLA